MLTSTLLLAAWPQLACLEQGGTGVLWAFLRPTVQEAEGDPGCRRGAAEGAEEDKGSKQWGW